MTDTLGLAPGSEQFVRAAALTLVGVWFVRAVGIRPSASRIGAGGP